MKNPLPLFSVALILAIGLSTARAQQEPILPVREVPIYPKVEIKVDGLLNDPAWRNAGKLTPFKEKEGGTITNGTEVLLYSDGRYLNFAFVCKDSEISKLKRTIKDHDGPFWADDAVEIFFDPWGKRMNLMHFGANALGTRYDAMGNDTHGWNPTWETAVSVEGDQWIVEGRIPLKEISPKGYISGDELLANFCRSQDSKKELSCWSNAYGGWKAANGLGTLVFGSLRHALIKKVDTLKADVAQRLAKPDLSARLKTQLNIVQEQAQALVIPKQVDAATYQNILATVDKLIIPLGEVAREEALALYREKGYAVWEKSEWELFPPKVDFPAIPSSKETKIGGTLLKGQSEYRTLLVANLMDEPLELMINSTLPKTSAKLYYSVFLRTKDGRLGADALMPPDNMNRLTIPVGEQREIWIELNGTGGQKIEGELTLTPITASLVDTVVPVSMTIKDADVSRHLPMSYGWSFLKDPEDHGLAEVVQNTLIENHAGWIMISGLRALPRPKADDDGKLQEPLDWSALDTILKRSHSDVMNRGAQFFIQLDIWEKRVTRHIFNRKYDSPGWEKAFQNWILQVIAKIKEAGYGYEHFAINPMDESVDERYLKLAKLVRAADPNVRLISNSAADVDAMKATGLDQYCDIYMPHRSQLVSEEGQRRVAYMLSTGKPVGFYFYSEGGNEKIRDPFQNFIWWFWYSHTLGLRNGPYGYWSMTQTYGDVWNRHKVPKTLYDVALIYPGNGIAIETRRMKAWKRSMEDIALLEAVEEKMAAETEPGKRQAMEKVYREALASVVGFDPAGLEIPLKRGTARRVVLTRSSNQINPAVLREAREKLADLLH